MTPGLELTVFSDGNAGVTDYTGTETEVRIPDRYRDRPVRYIAGDVFYGRTITRLLLPRTVQLIGTYEPDFGTEEPEIAFAGLAGQPVHIVCEAGCPLARQLVLEPHFQVELVDSLDGWVAQYG